MKLIVRILSLSLSLGLVLTSCKDDVVNEYHNTTGNKVNYDVANIPSDANEKGFFVLNEDWFGHDDGTINYFAPNGDIAYRAYRKANPGDKFGVTSQYGTVYGDNLYVTSKQGNRLVVADKLTLKKKAVLTDVGGDGRGFAGISPEKAYMGTSKGVSIINLKDFTFVKTIEGITEEVGNIIYANGYAFVVTHENVLVIDTELDAIHKTLEITKPACMVQAKDGSIWVGSANELTRIDPFTLDYAKVKDISNCGIFPTWYAWNKGSLSASTQENILYWATGNSSWNINKVAKYDIDKEELTPELFVLGAEKDYGISKDNETLDFYGAALNVNPLTDDVVLLVKRSGFGQNGSYNWLFLLNSKGEITKIVTVGDDGTGEDSTPGKEPSANHYYWFPSMPLFNDFYEPEILLNNIELNVGGIVQINLNKAIYDRDTPSAAIQLQFDIEGEDDIVFLRREGQRLYISGDAEGETLLKVSANSNGNIIERNIPVIVK